MPETRWPIIKPLPAQAMQKPAGRNRAPNPFKSGDRIAGQYVLEQSVAKGSVGTIWSAKEMGSGRRIALKFLNDDCLQDNDIHRMFQTELETLRAVDHPGVVSALSSALGLENGMPYFAMEFAPGADLFCFADGEPKPMGVRLGVYSAICEAVQAIHDKDVIHRDLKPNNIFVGECPRWPDTGSIDYRIKILDFGFAIMPGSFDYCSVSGILPGTSHFLAPELLFSPGSAGKLADIYSLGVCMYVTFCGSFPFRPPYVSGEQLAEMGRMDVADLYLNYPPVSVDVRAPYLPSSIRRIIRKAMSENLNSRYQSALELSGDIEEARLQLERNG